MTQVNTEYENLGPIVKELRELNVGNFFQFPGEGTVYRVLSDVEGGYLCLSLDDLQAFVQPEESVVEPREVNKIDVKVELL